MERNMSRYQRLKSVLKSNKKKSIIKNKLLMITCRIKFSKRFNKFGKCSILIKPMRIVGEKHILIGDNVYILNGARFEAVSQYLNGDYSPHIIVGDNTSIGQNFHITAVSDLEIEHDVTISGNVFITDNNHGYQLLDINVSNQPMTSQKTRIGAYSFIGYGACILEGVVLGKQCIIGANSVVTHGKYPDYSVIAGNPARIIKRYNPETRIWENVNEDKIKNC